MDEGEQTEEKLKKHIEDMGKLLNIVCNFDKNELGLLSIILHEAYHDKELHGRIKLNHLIEKTEKYLKTHKEKLTPEQVSYLSNIIKSFQKVSNETIGGYLNSDNVVDLIKIFKENNYVVLDFCDIDSSSSLFDLYGYYVFSQLERYAYGSKIERLNTIKDSSIDEYKYKSRIVSEGIQPFQIIIDEVWQYLRNDFIGEKIYGFAKQIRNQVGGVISITQQLADLSGTVRGAALLSQSDSLMVFKGFKPDEIETIEELLKSGEDSVSFDESDKNFIKGETVAGEALFSFGKGKIPTQKIKVYGRDYGSIFKGINN